MLRKIRFMVTQYVSVVGTDAIVLILVLLIALLFLAGVCIFV